MAGRGALTRLIAASGLTNLGDGIATVAWAWLASLLTRDALLIALVPVALRLPWFLFAIPAGLVTDRVDRKRLILRMDLLRAAGFALAGLSVWQALPLDPAPERGVSSLALFVALMGSAALVGAAEVFRDNAAQTMLPAIVPHAELERANGRLWSVELIGNALLGPAIGALLITVFLPLPLLLNALFYAMAALLVAGIAGKFRPREARQAHWRADLAEAARYLRDAPLLRLLAWVTGFWNLLFQIIMIALVLHVQENLGRGADGYGLILAVGALGGILGGLMGERIVRALGPGRTAQWMLLASAPCFIAMAFAPNALAVGLVLAVCQWAGLVWNTVSVAYRQRSIPDRLLGRVNSLYRLLAWGMLPLGMLLSGVITRGAEALLPRGDALIAPFVVAAVGSALLSALSWAALGREFAAIRHMPSP